MSRKNLDFSCFWGLQLSWYCYFLLGFVDVQDLFYLFIYYYADLVLLLTFEEKKKKKKKKGVFLQTRVAVVQVLHLSLLLLFF
jgi:hypothetical protein